MLQRWALGLSAYNFDVEYRSGKLIPHADYLSRNCFQEPAGSGDEDAVLVVNPLPIDRNKLIAETKATYDSILAGFRSGWSVSAKRKFP